MALVDTGLVVRYYCDEAGSGTAPTSLLDASSNGYNLPITYDGTELVYVDTGGNKGLDFTTTATDARASTPVVTSDAIDSMEGGTGYTMELVMRIDSITGSHSRIFGVHPRAGGAYDIGLKASSASNYIFQWNNQDNNDVTIDLAASSRAVYHIVVDTTQGVKDDRVRFYKNNVELTTGKVVGTIASSGTLVINDGSVDLIVGNRESSGSFQRAFDGVMFYAAMYTGAMSSADRTTNYGILGGDDDTPGGEPAPSGPGTSAYTQKRRRGMAA